MILCVDSETCTRGPTLSLFQRDLVYELDYRLLFIRGIMILKKNEVITSVKPHT